MLARPCKHACMSEEGYIKAPCEECHGRISLPSDAVGVDFNCPHCGVGLQMLLKHTCEHCGGRLSFDGNPGAIGMEIECGHCQNATVLAPSTFALNGGTDQPAQEEYEDEGEEEYEDEEEYAEEEEGIPKPDTETRRRGDGPPKPRAPKRGGPPKPRQPRKARSGRPRPGQKPEKISRSIAGSGEAEAEETDEQQRRPQPKRRGQDGGQVATPRRVAGATQQLDEDPADPMSGDLPGAPAAAPSAPGSPAGAPMQRKVAGAPTPGAEGSAGAAAPQPQFRGAEVAADDDYDDDDGPWYKDKQNKKLAIVVGIFVLMFGLVGAPALGLYPSPFSMFGGGYRTNRTDQIKFDEQSFKIETDVKNKSVYYITGLVRNTSSEEFEQVELVFILYDQQGTKLGESLDFTNKLGSGREWRFRAPCMFTNVARADLGKVVVR